MSKRQTFGFTAFHVDFHSAVFSSAVFLNPESADSFESAEGSG